MSDISATLRQRAQVARDEAGRLDTRINRVSIARLVTTAAFLIAGALAISEPERRTLFGIATAALIALFVALVRRSQRLDSVRRFALARAKVNEQAALRVERAWPDIDPQPWTWPSDHDEPLRTDLDVVGSASLVQLLPTISRALGAPLFRAWFGNPDPHTDELRARQTSIAELRDAIDLREANSKAKRSKYATGRA